MVRVLGKKSVNCMVDTEPANTISPLCVAALGGALGSLDALLDIGADLEFEGHPTGTALMVASASGDLRAVRYLVHRGVKTHYISNRVRGNRAVSNRLSERSAIALAERHPDVIRWLLVERYTEQAKIESTSCGIGSEEPLRLWSGVRKIEYPLVGDRARLPAGSSFGFLCHVYNLKLSPRGKVVHYTGLCD